MSSIPQNNVAHPMEMQMPMDQEANRFDFLGMLWRRKWLMILGLAVGLGLGFLKFKREVPVFASSMKVMISNRAAANVLSERGGTYLPPPSIPHDQIVVSSGFIRDYVVGEKEGINRLDQIAALKSLSKEAQAGRVASGLGISQDATHKSVYYLTYTSNDRDLCPKVLYAVYTAYEEYLAKEHSSQAKELRDLIESTNQEVREKLEQVAGNLAKFKKDNPDLSFREGYDLINPPQQTIDDATSQIRSLTFEKTNLDTDRKRIQELILEGKSEEVILYILNRTREVREEGGVRNSTDPDREEYERLKIEKSLLLEKYGLKHSKVQQVDLRMRMIEQYLLRRGNDGPIATEPSKEATNFVTLYQISLDEKIKTLDAKIEVFQKIIDENEPVATSINERKQALDNILHEQNTLMTWFHEIGNKLNQLDVTKRTEGYTFQVMNEPSGGGQISPNLSKELSTVGVIGLLVGLGIGFLVELADKTFRSPVEISHALNLPIVGHIPFITASKKDKDVNSALHHSIMTIHKPKSKIAEAYRAVRTALFFSNREHSHKVLQVTSPSPGDGKSTLALNIAISIAQSGKRVLLVDADLRRPRQHRLLGEDIEQGFAAVLRGEVDPIEATVSTEVPNLWFIPCGERPSNPAELLTSPRLQEFIDVVREQYDYVIIDTPPLLAVTDPAAVAPRVDGVVLTFKIRKNIKLTSERARGILTSVGANILGVVVTGVGGQQGYSNYKYQAYARGNRYYGTGSYSYGYGYSYGYDYGYENSTYYDEPKEGKKAKKDSKLVESKVAASNEPAPNPTDKENES